MEETYQIRVRGHLDDRWADWLGGWSSGARAAWPAKTTTDIGLLNNPESQQG
jgi:hypothetical protein